VVPGSVSTCSPDVSFPTTGIEVVVPIIKVKGKPDVNPPNVPLSPTNRANYTTTTCRNTTNGCQIIWTCKNCRANPLANSTVTISLDHNSATDDVDRLFATSILWNVSSTSGVTLRNNNQRSSIQGTIVPSGSSKSFRGPTPTTITATLTQTFFQDTDTSPNVKASGYHVEYDDQIRGSEVSDRTFSDVEGLRIQFQFHVFPSSYQVTWSTITDASIMLSAALGAVQGLLGPFATALFIFEFGYILVRKKADPDFAKKHSRIKEMQKLQEEEEETARKALIQKWEHWENSQADGTKNETQADVEMQEHKKEKSEIGAPSAVSTAEAVEAVSEAAGGDD